MHDEDALVRQYVGELRRLHGDAAFSVAEANMREAMDNGDVKAAGIWLSVMYALNSPAASVS